ncbi:MAG: protein-disulfide reductase DsbD family protein [bacterium]|nr:protein-disulfide reductase DsbD family protein [bacterium]
MKQLFQIVTFLLILLVGEKAFSQNVKAELVIHDGTQSVQDTHLVGVRFLMDPNWHIYWHFPGDSGLPTRINWKLPPGATSGPLLWPVPEKFIQKGSPPTFGYDQEVVLLSEIMIPPSLREGDLVVEVKWLACDLKLCVPGKTSLNLPIEELRSAKNSKRSDLTFWIDQVPTPLINAPFTQEISLKKENSSITIKADLSWKEKVGNIEWYPVLGDKLIVSSENISEKEGKTELRMTLNLIGNLSSNLNSATDFPTQLNSVIVFTTVSGKRRGVDFPILLK